MSLVHEAKLNKLHKGIVDIQHTQRIRTPIVNLFKKEPNDQRNLSQPFPSKHLLILSNSTYTRN